MPPSKSVKFLYIDASIWRGPVTNHGFVLFEGGIAYDNCHPWKRSIYFCKLQIWTRGWFFECVSPILKVTAFSVILGWFPSILTAILSPPFAWNSHDRNVKLTARPFTLKHECKKKHDEIRPNTFSHHSKPTFPIPNSWSVLLPKFL